MTFMCLVQQGALTAAARERLEAGLSALASRELAPRGDASFAWMEVAPGCGFTAGEPSAAAIVATTVPAGTGRDVRVRFLAGVCDVWARETGCHLDDVLATALDDGTV